MRLKYIVVGLILGVFLTISTTVAADSISRIGKQIEGEYIVKLDGQALPVKAVGLEGTTFGPIRVLAESLGLEVDFINNEVVLATTENKGEIILESEYKGLRAVEKDGGVFFNLKDYNDTWAPYGWGVNSDKNTIYLAEFVTDSSEIVKTFLEVDLTDTVSVVNHKGSTYVNIKHYMEPDELEEEPISQD